MKKDIKLAIIQVAKKLFNERGYNQVSTQDIAAALGISKGNLNYHFKRKEDIIEAVVEEMHSHYVRPESPATLEELNALFLRCQQVATENAFYFWHFTQLSQTSQKIKKIQNNVIADMHAVFFQAFDRLNKNGSFQKEVYPQHYEQIIYSVMLTCIYWNPHSRLTESAKPKVTFLDCIWAILHPLLTEAGKAEVTAKLRGMYLG